MMPPCRRSGGCIDHTISARSNMMPLMLAVGVWLMGTCRASAPHLEINMIYGMGSYGLGQMTLGKQGGGTSKTPWVTHLPYGTFADQVQAYKAYKIPSFYGDMSSPYTSPLGASKIFLRGGACTPASYPVCHLGPQWEETLELLVQRDIKPGIENGTLAGVFLGDELCCEDMPTRTGMECWETVIAPVADKLRALLGKGNGKIYTNECGGEQMFNSTMIKNGWKMPASLDIVSTDAYSGWLPPGAKCPDADKCPWSPSQPCFNTSGLCPQGSTDPAVSEVSGMKTFIDKSIIPAMHPHQRFLAVPGTFGCHALDANNITSPMSNASSAAAVVAKLDAWMKYARTEPRIIGFNPWHWDARQVQVGAFGSPCDMQVGASEYPSVVAKLAEIGHEIIQQPPKQ